MTAVARRALLYGVPAAVGAALVTRGAPARAAAAGTVGSPKDFGAVADGVTDDAKAINACLQAHRAVDFGGPENVYLVRETVLAAQAAPQVLFGQGATIKAGADVVLMRLQRAAHTVSGLVLDGAGLAGSLGLIVEPTAPHSVVERCVVRDFGRFGVSVESAHSRVAGCSVRNCGHDSPADELHQCAVRVYADFCTVADNELLDCNWGVYFRGASAIRHYRCAGNTIVCSPAARTDSQGISNRNGRNGRIDGNIVVGFKDNSMDCWGCADMTISGNVTEGGKDGIFVGDPASGRFAITGNSFSAPQRGVRVHSAETTGGALVIGIVISGNTVFEPSDGGILANEGELSQLSGITVADNDIHVNRKGRYGIRMVRVEASRISGNRVYRPLQEAIKLTGVDVVQVSDNLLQDAGAEQAGTRAGLLVEDSNRVTVRNTTAYGSARHAVQVTGGVGMTVTGTRWRSIAGEGVDVPSPDVTLADNRVM